MPTTLESLPRFISLAEAGKRLSLDETRLQELILVGTLKAARIEGETVVDETKVDQIASQPKKEDLEEYKQFAHLAGEKISVSDAARKYGIPQGTFSRWVQAGYIKRLGSDGYRAYLDGQDVAYCAFVFEKRGGRGKRIFNKDGTPYKTKAELLQED